MKNQIKENVIEQLTDTEHILRRSGMYLGATVPTKYTTFILDKSTDKFVYQEVEFVPGFLKILNEIIDNSVDEFVRTNGKFANCISVDIDPTTSLVKITDNGRGIPLKEVPGTGKSGLEVSLTSLRAGSNFNDEDGRKSLGMNGMGSVITVCFSKIFKATVYDGKMHGELVCKDNLSSHTCTIEKCKTKKTGTSIEFTPDLERFGMEAIDEIHTELIRQRLMFLSFIYPEIKFSFNGSLVKFKTAKTFMSYFADSFVVEEDHGAPKRYLIGVIPNEFDEFCHESYINGAHCVLGGNHIDYIHSELVGRIKEKLSRKYPSIKPGDIKSRLAYIINFREFINPTFNSQTKENFTSNANEIKAFLKDVDWDAFAERICRCKEIIEPITEAFRIKEELQKQKTLEKIGQVPKKFKCKKFLPATETNKYFAIVEGDSAAAGLSDGFGRKEIGYFSTKGVPMNTYEAKIQKIADNEELNNMIKALGLKLGSETQNLTYENIAIATDADCISECTEVLTQRGPVKAKDIKYGDRVLTHTGKWKQVIEIFEKPKCSFVEVEINGEPLPMRFGPTHRIPVVRDGEVKLVIASDLKTTDLLLKLRS